MADLETLKTVTLVFAQVDLVVQHAILELIQKMVLQIVVLLLL